MRSKSLPHQTNVFASLPTGMYKWLGTVLMLAVITVQIDLNQMLVITSHAHNPLPRDLGMFSGLLAVLFLLSSVTKPVLRYASKMAEELSMDNISNIYFSIGGICFLCFILL
jgi:hypothetical protein